MLLEIEERTSHLNQNLVSDLNRINKLSKIQSSRNIPQIHLEKYEDKDSIEIDGQLKLIN